MSSHPEQKCNSSEEKVSIDAKETKNQTQKFGHYRLLSMEPEAKMEDMTTVKATYVQPKGPGVRLRGCRIEHLEKHIAQITREKIKLQMKPAPCEPEYCSETQQSFRIQGFVPQWERITPVHDHKFEDSITFWSENIQRVQGVTPVRSPGAPFRKCSEFSRPISERLDEPAPPPED